MYRLILAKHFAGGQIIYFPHNIDFRGRTYPISPQINHMGDDINRGLLKFAKGNSSEFSMFLMFPSFREDIG
jgi:DNA-directed RNA polymerase, mitochondrial